MTHNPKFNVAKACAAVIDSFADYDTKRLCCDGTDCECGGITVHAEMKAQILALLAKAAGPGPAPVSIDRLAGPAFHIDWQQVRQPPDDPVHVTVVREADLQRLLRRLVAAEDAVRAALPSGGLAILRDAEAVLRWARGCVPFPSSCHLAVVRVLDSLKPFFPDDTV